MELGRATWRYYGSVGVAVGQWGVIVGQCRISGAQWGSIRLTRSQGGKWKVSGAHWGSLGLSAHCIYTQFSHYAWKG